MAIKASPARAPREKHTAIYLRVSTTGQDHASQRPELERWVGAHEGDAVWYRDKFTGKTMERPGMSRLLKAVQGGQIQRIVVWRLDRLGRTARGLCELFEELTARKVDLVSIRDGFNLASASGRLHARILAAWPSSRPRSAPSASGRARPPPVPAASAGAAARRAAT